MSKSLHLLLKYFVSKRIPELVLILSAVEKSVLRKNFVLMKYIINFLDIVKKKNIIKKCVLSLNKIDINK